MGNEPAVSGPKCQFVGGATFSNDISATIPLIRLEVGVEGLEFRFRGPLGWFLRPRALGHHDVEAVYPAKGWLLGRREVDIIPRAPRGTWWQFYPLDPVEAVLEAMEACGYPVDWRQHDRMGKLI